MEHEHELHGNSHFHRWNMTTAEEKKNLTQHKKDNVISIQSEIGKLKRVLIHTPGCEVEKMVPGSAKENLFNDIVFYKKIVQGHSELKKVLAKTAEVLEVKQCLAEVLEFQEAREQCLNQILTFEKSLHLKDQLNDLDSKTLASVLVEGYKNQNQSLENYLTPSASANSYALRPLHNLYFTRDTSVVFGNKVISMHMANSVRSPESMISRMLFKFHPKLFNLGSILDSTKRIFDPEYCLEGGDIHIWSSNLILVGLSERTKPRAIDALIDSIVLSRKADSCLEPFHVVCVDLPKTRAILHLDMIFTKVNKSQALVYAPLVLSANKLRVIKITVNSKGEKKFTEYADLISCLATVGYKIDPIVCGGTDVLHMEREQWASGANSFALAPGQIICYDHEHTLRSFEKSGFTVMTANDYVKETVPEDQSIVVAIDGAELSRGGGGPRCMTCPILRD